MAKGMNELAKEVATKLGGTITDATKAINAVKEAILESCKAGEEVNLVGFAKFSADHKPARQCINPQNPTGPKISVVAKTVFKVKASPAADVTPVAASGRRK